MLTSKEVVKAINDVAEYCGNTECRKCPFRSFSRGREMCKVTGAFPEEAAPADWDFPDEDED